MASLPLGNNMQALIEAQDWDLEAVEGQGFRCPVFRTMLGLCFSAATPTALFWGADFRLFYGDRWAPLLGQRHPWALGKPACVIWPERWEKLSPQFEQIRATGQSVRLPPCQDAGMDTVCEDTRGTYSLSPIHDEHGEVKGLLCQFLGSTIVAQEKNQPSGRPHHAPPAIGGVGAWEWDLATDRVTTDAPFAAFCGIDPLAAAAGAPIADFTAAVHPDDRFRLAAAINEARSTGLSLDIDCRVPRSAGDLWIWVRGKGHRDANGVLTHLRGIGIDVTARKQAEGSIKPRSAPQIFLGEMDVVLRKGGSLQAVCEGVCGALGIALGVGQVSYTGIDADGAFAVPEWAWNDGSIPTTLDRHRSTDFGIPLADDLQHGRRVVVEDVARDPRTSAPDRQEMFTSLAIGAFVIIPVIKEDRLVAVLAVHQAKPRDWMPEDVLLADKVADRVWTTVKREHAEAALRASETRLQTIVNSIDPMIWSSREDGRHDFFNQRWYDFTGMPTGSTESKGWVDLFHPDDRQAVELAWQKCLATGQSYHHEFRLRHHSGAYRWILGRAHPVRDPESDVVRWYGTATEIDEIIAAREVLARSQVELEALVDERTAALMVVEGKLRQSQKMEAIGQLTGGIAHDFNNMLTIVMGSLDLLSRYFLAADARVLRYISSAREGARRAAALTRQLLAFSRQQPLAPELLQINYLVASMSEMLSRALGSDIHLETILEAGLEQSFVDPNQLENAILNLALNARDAMVDGGKLTIETRNVFFDDHHASDNFGTPAGHYVMIAVTDTGTGMPSEVLAKAFDPFFTTKGIGLGTGLGLSQVYGFVQQSGGSVQIYSQFGEGTTLKIYLPSHLAKFMEPSKPATTPTLALGSHHELILVVEDEAAVRRISADALRELGYRVLEADSAAAALPLIEAHDDIALMLTDIIMPGLNGRKLAEAARVIRPDLKVLFTTGQISNATVHGDVHAAETDLILKPFTLQELTSKLRKMLDMVGNVELRT